MKFPGVHGGRGVGRGLFGALVSWQQTTAYHIINTGTWTPNYTSCEDGTGVVFQEP